jgi:hypothetical protein
VHINEGIHVVDGINDRGQGQAPRNQQLVVHDFQNNENVHAVDCEDPAPQNQQDEVLLMEPDVNGPEDGSSPDNESGTYSDSEGIGDELHSKHLKRPTEEQIHSGIHMIYEITGKNKSGRCRLKGCKRTTIFACSILHSM